MKHISHDQKYFYANTIMSIFLLTMHGASHEVVCNLVTHTLTLHSTTEWIVHADNVQYILLCINSNTDTGNLWRF